MSACSQDGEDHEVMPNSSIATRMCRRGEQADVTEGKVIEDYTINQMGQILRLSQSTMKIRWKTSTQSMEKWSSLTRGLCKRDQ